MQRRLSFFILFIGLACVSAWYILFDLRSEKPQHSNLKIGDAIDSLDGIAVYYGNPGGRNLSEDDYNYSLRWQCVEFVKRYYYQCLHHTMPNPWGNAVDFFDITLSDSSLNEQRGLLQFRNGISRIKPQYQDIVVYGGVEGNPYGHVAIIAAVNNGKIEMIQQNLNLEGTTRTFSTVDSTTSGWKIGNGLILGWLRVAAVSH